MENLDRQLVEFVDFCSKENSKKVLERIFGLDFLEKELKEGKTKILNTFLTKKIHTGAELLSYDDCYDFINTITGIDTDLLYLYLVPTILLEYTLSIIKLLNRHFQNYTESEEQKCSIYLYTGGEVMGQIDLLLELDFERY